MSVNRFEAARINEGTDCDAILFSWKPDTLAKHTHSLGITGQPQPKVVPPLTAWRVGVLILKIARPVWFLMAGVTILLAAEVAFKVQVPITQGAYFQALIRQKEDNAKLLVATIFGMEAGTWILRYAGMFMRVRVSTHIVNSVRLRLFHNILQQDNSFYDDNSTGDLLHVLTDDALSAQDMFTEVLPLFITSLGVLVFAFVAMAGVSLEIALVAMATSFIIGCLNVYAGMLLGPLATISKLLFARTTTKIHEALQHVNTLRAFNTLRAHSELLEFAQVTHLTPI